MGRNIAAFEGYAAAFSCSVGGAAVTLTDDAIGFTAAQMLDAARARIGVETKSVRYSTVAGAAPDATDGVLVAAGNTFFIEGHGAVNNLQLIGIDGTAVLQIILER